LPAVVDDGEREAEQELDDWLAETVVEAEQEAHVGERDPEDRVGAGRVEYRRWTASSSR